MQITLGELTSKLTSSSRSAYLDAYRGLACLMVYFYHSATNLTFLGLTLWGFTGVHLFFVISGYLIFQPFLKSLLTATPLPSIKQFYQNRLVRIMPPFLVALALYTGLRYATHTNIPTPVNILAHVFLIFNYFTEKDFFSINPVFWSLAIEGQFYLLLPLVVYFALKIGRSAKQSPNVVIIVLLSFLFLVGIASRGLELRYTSSAHSANIPFPKFRSILSFLDMFSIGMAIAFVEKSGVFGKLVLRVSPFFPLFLGAFLLVAGNAWCSVVSPGEWMNSNHILYTLLFSPLVCAGFGLFLLTNILYPRTQKNILNTFPLVLLGTISYSVYLYHVGVQFAVFSHLHLGRYIHNWGLMAFLNGLVALPFVLLTSTAMYFLIEKPTIQWLKRNKKALSLLADMNGAHAKNSKVTREEALS